MFNFPKVKNFWKICKKRTPQYLGYFFYEKRFIEAKNQSGQQFLMKDIYVLKILKSRRDGIMVENKKLRLFPNPVGMALKTVKFLP